MKWLRGFAVAVGLGVSAGCGGVTVYPVQGQIVDKAGNPVNELKGSTVVFESDDQKHSASGVVDDKGKFSMSTKQTNDGAHVGKHRVAILRPDSVADVRIPHVIDPKYENLGTSDLTVTVEKRANNVKLEVDRINK
jgi:hypothetical protein